MEGMESSKNGSRKLRIFVRRGALRRFHRLKRDAKDLPVDIEWDRSRDIPLTIAAMLSAAKPETGSE